MRKNIIITTLVIIIIGMTIRYNNLNTQIQRLKNTNKSQVININRNNTTIKNQQSKINELNIIQNDINNLQQSIDKVPEFLITAYDLGLNSCQKRKSSRGYGITYGGIDLKGHSWRSARVIACDNNIIPLNKLVYLYFIDSKYSRYTGIYINSDRGSKIIGRHIDLFLGDFKSEKSNKKTLEFGTTKAKVIILN
jgi:3D (Asp-Asp-Asp) domain-containing protein